MRKRFRRVERACASQRSRDGEASYSLRAAMLLSMRARAKHQLPAVRNNHGGSFIVSGLLFTMTFATPTCRPSRALKIMQDNTRAGVPSGAAVTFEPVVH
jgi:hypothetical protein